MRKMHLVLVLGLHINGLLLVTSSCGGEHYIFFFNHLGAGACCLLFLRELVRRLHHLLLERGVVEGTIFFVFLLGILFRHLHMGKLLGHLLNVVGRRQV